MSSNRVPAASGRTVRVHSGIPPRESSMPTCGVCRRQIQGGEEYATVRELNRTTGLREIRHNTEECLKYTAGSAASLVEGALIHSFRYSVCEWGGTIPGRIVERTERFDEKGWRVYIIEAADPADESPLNSFRNHREAWARKLGEETAWDPSPREVPISDEEWTHYVLPD